MPRVTLTNRKVAALKAPAGTQIDYFDRSLPGFGVRVNQAGTRTFVLLYRTKGKLRRMTIGTYPDLSLAKAREQAQGELRKSTIGRDPATERHEAKAHTVGALCDLYLEQHAKRKKRSWRDDARMIRMELKDWTDRPVASIRRADVRALLEAIVTRGAPVVANRVLALVRKILNFALDREWVESNVAAKMARPAAEHSRTRVLTEDEIRAVWSYLGKRAPRALDTTARRQWTLARAVLKLRLLTAQRGQEVVSMRWSDIDGTWWTIPSEASKNKLPHRVPLSPAALKVLETVKGKTAEGYVFAGIRGTRQRRGALEGLTLTDVRPHDFRRTAASLMASGRVPRLTISKILNHVETSVTAVYDRHGYDAEKAAALDWWASKVESIVRGKAATVLSFAKGA
jgi:integrase